MSFTVFNLENLDREVPPRTPKLSIILFFHERLANYLVVRNSIFGAELSVLLLSSASATYLIVLSDLHYVYELIDWSAKHPEEVILQSFFGCETQ